MKIQTIQWVKGKPYFLYKISDKKPDFAELRKRVPHTRAYWTKVHNLRTGQSGYAIYLDRKVSYY